MSLCYLAASALSLYVLFCQVSPLKGLLSLPVSSPRVMLFSYGYYVFVERGLTKNKAVP